MEAAQLTTSLLSFIPLGNNYNHPSLSRYITGTTCSIELICMGRGGLPVGDNSYKGARAACYFDSLQPLWPNAAFIVIAAEGGHQGLIHTVCGNRYHQCHTATAMWLPGLWRQSPARAETIDVDRFLTLASNPLSAHAGDKVGCERLRSGGDG